MGNNGTLSIGLTDQLRRAAGNGTFGTSRSVSTSSIGIDISSADFNNDSFLDLVIATDTGSAEILLGTASDAFTLGPSPSLGGGTCITPIATGDFNRDGRPDFVTNDVDGLAHVVLGNGNGTFQTVSTQLNIGSSGTSAVATGDFNGDGKTDVAFGGSKINVFYGAGNGTFKPSLSITVAGTGSMELRTGDLNEDGYMDLVSANNVAGSTSLAVFFGNSSGGFGPA